MKFSCFNNGQLGLLLGICVLVTSCNPEEYYPTEEFILGDDAFCSQALDLESCQQLADKCQPAFHYSENESEAPQFHACVTAPPIDPPINENNVVFNDQDGFSDPGSEAIQQAYATNCKGLDPKYLLVKKIVSKNKTKHVSQVKICHMSGNAFSHTIMIACPALKAHINHHDDYLGSCQI